jgi:tRNA A58 N-methylase Trm61
MMEMAGLAPGAKAIEVGAGTGIATEPLVRRGLAVTAIEPAAEMAAIAKSKLCAGMMSRAESFVFDPPIWSRERDVSWYGSPPSEKHQSLLRTSYS